MPPHSGELEAKDFKQSIHSRYKYLERAERWYNIVGLYNFAMSTKW